MPLGGFVRRNGTFAPLFFVFLRLFAPLEERGVSAVERQLVHPLVPLPVRPRRTLQQQRPLLGQRPRRRVERLAHDRLPRRQVAQVPRDRPGQPAPRLGPPRQLLGG